MTIFQQSSVKKLCVSFFVFVCSVACTCCSSMNAIKSGDLSGIITAPFELADNVLDTTSILEGKDPKWTKQLPRTYTDRQAQAKVVVPRSFNYSAVSWDGQKDDRGFATGQGTLKAWGSSGSYACSETGNMVNGKFVGSTKEIDKEGKEWKCEWQNGLVSSRTRVYSARELAEKKQAELSKKKAEDARKAERSTEYNRDKDYLLSFRRRVGEGSYVKAVPHGASNDISLAMFGGGVFYGRIIAELGSESIRVRRENYRLGDSTPEVFSSSRRRVFPPEWSSSKVRYHIGD